MGPGEADEQKSEKQAKADPHEKLSPTGDGSIVLHRQKDNGAHYIDVYGKGKGGKEPQPQATEGGTAHLDHLTPKNSTLARENQAGRAFRAPPAG